MPKKKILTSAFGAPIANDQNSRTAGVHGPIVLEDVHFLEKISHFDRERIPERVVHAKGGGAHGTFEVTGDVSKYTKADFLSKKGKKVDVFVRFSTVGGEKGSADTERDPRGFAVKFYTEEGNYDLVGNNTPVFFIRDPLKFPDFIHTQKRHPASNLKDATMFWDFLSLTPESMHQVTILFSDYGTPDGFRYMHGYGSHTYKWYTNKSYCWVKYHFVTDQKSKNLTRQEADALKSSDADYALRDLFSAIEEKKYPSWTLKVQIMTPEQAKKYPIDIFDVTKVWPHKDFPLIELGKMVLNRNPENYFAEVEQAAFNPSNFVDGITASPDKMLQGRLFSYHDTHLHRLGANYHQIPVNRTKAAVNNYQRDSYMQMEGGGSGPNYWPNSMNGPAPSEEYAVPEGPEGSMEGPEGSREGSIGHFEYPPQDDFVQPGNLYRNVMKEKDRENLIANIATHLCNALERIQYRQCALFMLADNDYGRRVAKKLKLDLAKVEKLSKMSQEDRAKATAK